MAADTQYKPLSFKFGSHGVIARYATDSAPPETYLNLANSEEREEGSMSSRRGSQLVMRDPSGVANGQNYFLPSPIHSISRLKYGTSTYRYAGSGTTLLRRVGDSQGPYTPIYNALSGQPFGSVVNTCFESALDYLFIADQNVLLKESGGGTPTRWGILPPNVPANVIPYAPHVLMIDKFDGTTTYATTDMESWASSVVGNVTVGAGTSVQDFFSYPVTSGFLTAFNGVVGSAGASTAVLFNLTGLPDPEQISAGAVQGSAALTGAETAFTVDSFSGAVAANATASVGNTVNLDLDQNSVVTDDDLIAICMQLSDPSAISEIKLMFDVNNSGYTSSYYYKSISPANYQGGISGTDDATTAATDEILANTLGLLTGSSTTSNGTDVIAQLQSSTANTGNNAWSTIYSRRGDFLAVGNAGEPGQGWASVTGWQIQITTETDASVQISVNGLYLQWGAGPSSFGGVGYDYRFTYQNLSTGTESNGSQEQAFSTNYGGTASRVAPIVLRQAIGVLGVYSPDPQVGFVNIYRRGGSMNQNWYYLDQIPNVVGNAPFLYKDIIPDASLLESNVLLLDNDPPITSSLQVPIATTLKAAYNPGTNPYQVFAPVTISTNDPAIFVVGQILQIGTPQNLEEVRVVTGGQGTFAAVLRLVHAAGEQVQAFSVPAQACDLCEVAYNKMWLAGDVNNPSFLYYSKPGYPETFGPQNYIEIGTPDSTITAIINWRGTLFVATQTTWWQVVDGAPPYAQPTGSAHGLIAKRGWCFAEGSIWYTALDGIREFRGSDGAYRTLQVEWLFQDPDESQQTPLVLVDTTRISLSLMAFHKNRVYFAYIGVDGNVHRLIFDLRYGGRIRNDDLPVTAMFLEKDTETLLVGRPVGQSYAIAQDRTGNVDDTGWAGGFVAAAPIASTIQIPFQDAGQPHNPKQWNMVELDVNTNGQDLNVALVLQNPNVTLNLGKVNTTTRSKIDLPVNSGEGIEAYRCSVVFNGSFTSPMFLYQAEMYIASLADYRNTFDTYWIKFGTDESKLVKQCYFDYEASKPVNMALYADGDFLDPYFTFVLPATTTRSVVRVRFSNDDEVNSAMILRLFRMVGQCPGTFRFWVAPRIEYKGVTEGSSYAVGELPT